MKCGLGIFGRTRKGSNILFGDDTNNFKCKLINLQPWIYWGLPALFICFYTRSFASFLCTVCHLPLLLAFCCWCFYSALFALLLLHRILVSVYLSCQPTILPLKFWKLCPILKLLILLSWLHLFNVINVNFIRYTSVNNKTALASSLILLWDLALLLLPRLCLLRRLQFLLLLNLWPLPTTLPYFWLDPPFVYSLQLELVLLATLGLSRVLEKTLLPSLFDSIVLVRKLRDKPQALSGILHTILVNTHHEKHLFFSWFSQKASWQCLSSGHFRCVDVIFSLSWKLLF